MGRDDLEVVRYGRVPEELGGRLYCRGLIGAGRMRQADGGVSSAINLGGSLHNGAEPFLVFGVW